MDNNNCYIEFDILNDDKFYDLKRTFELFKQAKNNGEPKNDKFWLHNFPPYALEKFYFLDTDLKPSFKTAERGEFTWHFYSLIEKLEINYEIEYVSCEKKERDRGRMEYEPYSYPYGGITGLVTFIRSFDCYPVKIDDGTSVYQIDFLPNGDFSITDLLDPERQNSAEKLFNTPTLLRKFVNRLRNK